MPGDNMFLKKDDKIENKKISIDQLKIFLVDHLSSKNCENCEYKEINKEGFHGFEFSHPYGDLHTLETKLKSEGFDVSVKTFTSIEDEANEEGNHEIKDRTWAIGFSTLN